MNYCISIWGLTTKCNVARIHVLQKKAMRIISHSPYTSHAAPLFVKLNILPIYDMISLQIGVFMFNCYKDLLPLPFKGYFQLNCHIHSYNTRNANNFHTPLAQTCSTKRSIFYFGPILWNDLPLSMKQANSANYFKFLLKRYLPLKNILYILLYSH